MTKRPSRTAYQILEAGGERYAVLPERVLQQLARKAGVELAPPGGPPSPPVLAGFAADDDTLAERLVERRKRAGLSQAELARRAEVRIETLNRIERSRVTPDFATVRKLVIALKAAEDAEESPGRRR